jgi:citrate synthase
MKAPERASGLDDVVVAATEPSLVDGPAGRMVYRGHDATELADTRSFEEVWHLLCAGHLPSRGELRAFRERLRTSGPTSRADYIAVRRAAAGEPLAAVRSALSALASVRGLRPWLERSPDPVGEEALALGGAMPALVALVHAELAGRPQVQRPKPKRPKGQAEPMRLDARDQDIVWAKAIARDGVVRRRRIV